MASTDSPTALYNAARSYLQQVDGNGLSLYEHLVDLVSQAESRHIIPATLSKKAHEIRVDSRQANVGALQQPSKPQLPSKAQVAQSKDAQQLLRSRAEAGANADSMVADLVAQQARLSACGEGVISVLEAHLLHAATLHIAKTHALTHVRFWGKVLARNAVYYVIESAHYDGTPISPFTAEVISVKDKKGRVIPAEASAGINAYTYWVSTTPATVDGWVALPDVTPAQIVVARKISKLLTGDLNAAVSSYPAFPGNEREYLRAQIARISSGAVIAPKGQYEAKPQPEQEDDKPLPPVTGPQILRAAAMEPVEGVEDLANWTHVHPLLLKLGRVTNVTFKSATAEGDEPAEEEEEEAKEEEKEALAAIADDASAQKLRTNYVPVPTPAAEDGAAGDDAPAEAEEDESTFVPIPPWTVRVANPTMATAKVVVVRSTRWPGLIAFAGEGGVENGCFYVGNGVKNEAFTPMPMPVMVADVKPSASCQDAETTLTYGEKPGDEQDGEPAAESE